eukprot:g3518.t1 g3518   contig12:2233972-2235690(-)
MNSPGNDPSAPGAVYSPTIAALPPLPEDINRSPSTPIANPKQPQPQPPPPPADTAMMSPTNTPNPDLSSPRLSSTWDPDTLQNNCSGCSQYFDPIFNRRHHCRLCGRLFCQDCSNTRSLIPPSALVLKANSPEANRSNGGVSFSPMNPDGDASVTYVRSNSMQSEDDTLLYGRGLEQRMLLARHPQRTCHSCRIQLAPLQEELCLRNSNAMRYNYIDEGDAVKRLCNSPLAFTLGHEVRKAAYTLSNLLPAGRGGSGKRGGFISTNTDNEYSSYPPREADPCHVPNGAPGCIDPTLRNLDGMSIPANLLQNAKGIAIVTACKGGLGFAGFEIGTGLVVARRRGDDGIDLDSWTAPSAIGIAGFAWGALVGAQVSDHVFLLMTEDAVRLFSSEDGKSIQLGADVGVALGPMGRSAEADFGATTSRSQNRMGGSGIAMAPVYTYSLSKGLYAGVSLDGRIVMTRSRVNEKFYGRAVTAHELLSGQVPTPPAAQPLYDALKRCRIYGGGGQQRSNNSSVGSNSSGSRDNQLMERWSHATGAGLPTAPSSSRSNNMNPYNLAGRNDPVLGYSSNYD